MPCELETSVFNQTAWGAIAPTLQVTHSFESMIGVTDDQVASPRINPKRENRDIDDPQLCDQSTSAYSARDLNQRRGHGPMHMITGHNMTHLGKQVLCGFGRFQSAPILKTSTCTRPGAETVLRKEASQAHRRQMRHASIDTKHTASARDNAGNATRRNGCRTICRTDWPP